MPDEVFFDGHADSYSRDIEQSIGFAGQDHSFFIKYKADMLIAGLEAEGDPKAAHVLDFGCGPGLLHDFLKDRIGALDAVDVSPNMIEVVKARNPWVKAMVVTDVRLPCADDAYDLVVAACVFHHVPPNQWVDVTRELARVVRPGGKLMIFEHNPFNPVTRHIVKTCPLDEGVVLLSPRVAKNVTRSGGWSEPSSKSILFFPFAGGVWRWIERRLGWLPLGAQYLLTATKR